VVATPIGNLEDITLRGLRVLSNVKLIAAEDTRTARKLLTAHGIKAPRLISYNDHNMRARIPAIIDALGDGDVALVSEAGTPGISDPGIELVAAAADAGHRVEPVPGPSALTTALAASGLPARRFRYLGFLPRRKGERVRLLREAARSTDTLVIFEAPHRVQATLADLLAALDDRRIAVCRELTKLHEDIFRGSLAEALAHFDSPRGEFTLVIEGAPAKAADDTIDVDGELARLRTQGARAREAVREVAELSGVARSEVYRRWLALNER
jgi:16S rRNA (cytidine1402-2'-O)-methyltransferase